MIADDRQGLEVMTGKVLAEWIDINNHMNVAYYVLAFDLAVDTLWRSFGITEEYISSQNNSTFAVEAHITYSQEMKLDDDYVICAQVLAFDSKRIHHFMRMYHADRGFLAATIEWLNLHVDMDSRRVSPWPEAVLERMHAFVSKQGNSGLPAEAGQKIGVPAPLWQIRGYGE